MGRRVFYGVLAGAGALIGFAFLNNTNMFAGGEPGRPALLAHRGVHQQFDHTDIESDTCTATRIHPPTHGFLENTIPSMRAAFDAGAVMVEFDVQPTTDGRFAVFHDWTLDCRTDGTGVTREHSMAELVALDIGHGYTADGGETFPFRGRGVGLMPSLDEVLAAFPEERFLIHIKSRDPEEGRLLAARLERESPESRARLAVYGDDIPIEALRQRLPDIPTTSPDRLRDCLLPYMAQGWVGWVPESCAGMIVLLPADIAPWLWGWPQRFIDRMASAGSEVFLLGPYDGTFSIGIDTEDDLALLPPDYSGGIWTNAVEEIAPALTAAEATEGE